MREVLLDPAVLEKLADKNGTYPNLFVGADENKEEKQKVLDALEGLTTRQLEALKYLFYDNLNAAEAGRKMNISRQAVYSLIHSALESLRKLLSPAKCERCGKDMIKKRKNKRYCC